MPTSTPTLATVEIKAFVPARDFALSQEFYVALGFSRASVVGGVACFHHGGTSFLLQDFFVQTHADNFQMHLLVEDAEAWHARCAPVAQRFGVAICALQDQPWAMRDFTLFDPSGVLWRIAQNLPRGATA